MLGRKPAKVTYAHKRRRVQRTSKKSLSSPLEVLPPETGDLTHTQMARRMLKRSRRVALAENLEERNVEHIREHLAKRIKHNQEPVSDPTGIASDMSTRGDTMFQTPFCSPRQVHELAIAKQLAPEHLSPVPAARRVISRTSSRNLKENSANPRVLASPFCSRPGSATFSPRHKNKGLCSRRGLGNPLHMKSRTLSGAFKESDRHVSRKNSTASLKDTNTEPRTKYIKHRRYPSSPSASYMRSQFSKEDWIVPPEALSRTFDNNNEISSPGASVHSDASFYATGPQFCSTPAISKQGKSTNLRGRGGRAVPLRKDRTEADGPDVEMVDGTVPLRHQTIHLSGNSIFSSSDEFTIRSPPIRNDNAATSDSNGVIGWDRAVPGRVSVPRESVVGPLAGHPTSGSFVAEYEVPLSDIAYSLGPTAATKVLGADRVPNLSVGEQLFSLPGTSPARGGCLVIRRCRGPSTLTPQISPGKTTVACPPSSPASDLALELGSMDMRDDPDTHSDGDTRRPCVVMPLQTRAHSLQGSAPPAESTATKKLAKRMPARNRAGTIRASDFIKPGPGASSSGAPVSELPNVRRTRSGTVVGPDSKLAAKSTATKEAPTKALAAVQSGSESESDDELLLRAAWMEDMDYLGLAEPKDRSSEADELNLGGVWAGSSRRLGLRGR